MKTNSILPSPQSSKCRRARAGVPYKSAFRPAWLLWSLIALAVSASTPAALASDRVGIYALVEKVVLEPADAPERIQIWGAFAFAKNGGDQYDTAQRGFIYYKLKPGKEDVCRKEWNDLKAVAGTRQCVGFASRWEDKGTLRKATDKPEKPDAYPVAWGVAKVRDSEYPPIKAIKALVPERPASK
jgi:hypothetical protein